MEDDARIYVDRMQFSKTTAILLGFVFVHPGTAFIQGRPQKLQFKCDVFVHEGRAFIFKTTTDVQSGCDIFIPLLLDPAFLNATNRTRQYLETANLLLDFVFIHLGTASFKTTTEATNRTRPFLATERDKVENVQW